MQKELEAEYDYIILGSTFQNSILAGALSRVGKRVLLIEKNCYYGCNNGTFSFQELHDFINGKDNSWIIPDDEQLQKEEVIRQLNLPITRRSVIWDKKEFDLKEEPSIQPNEVKEDDICIIQTREMWPSTPISHCEETYGVVKRESEEYTKGRRLASSEQLEKNSRKYNIDVNSSMILSRGAVVDVLAESGIGEYTQFYSINSISALVKEGLVRLPCSKQEVFESKSISLKEKRLLVKFIQYIGDSISSEEETKSINDVQLKQGRSLSRPQNKSIVKVAMDQYEKTPFVEFLEKEFQISGMLKDMIIYSICLTGSDFTFLSSLGYESLSTPHGIHRMQEFIQSLNVYGNTPFLYPIYGGGDNLQSFCRINNVYGGITMLQTTIPSVIINKRTNSVMALEVANDSIHHIIRCKHVICSDDYPIRQVGGGSSECCRVCHGITIAKGNNDATSNDEKTSHDVRDLVVVPANEAHRGIYLVILNGDLKVCPKGELLISAFCEYMKEEEIPAVYEHMKEAVEEYLHHLHSTIPVTKLYSCHFVENTTPGESDLSNVTFLFSRKEGNYLYLDPQMKRVKEVFSMLCPGTPFLPKTHTCQEANKEDETAQELQLFDHLLESIHLGEGNMVTQEGKAVVESDTCLIKEERTVKNEDS